MQLTDAEIAAIVGAVVILVQAIAAYLTNQKSAARAATTQAQVADLHQAVSDVTGAAPAKLEDGHQVK